jgi:hypothetical protein
VCCLLGIGSTILGRDLSGTVYSDHSGPSGNGTGIVTLATSTGLISIHYQKPIHQDFLGDNCRHLGALWTVRTAPWTARPEQKSLEMEELVRARCNGRVDVPVHSAWLATLNYIKEAAHHAGHELGFRPNRFGPINVNMDGINVDVSGYLNFPGNGMCLEVKERVSKATVVIESSADCAFQPDIEFTAKQTGPNTWAVIFQQSSGVWTGLAQGPGC